MSISNTSFETDFRFPTPHQVRDITPDQLQIEVLAAKLQSSLAREAALRDENRDLLQRDSEQSQEFNHRLFNGLQLIVSLLSAQSRSATPEVATELTIASGRIVAFGLVHRRLHSLDGQKNVEVRQYLRDLCVDLADLLFDARAGRAIVVDAATYEIPTALGIPVGLIVNELITNSTKYAEGDITVRFETTDLAHHSLSVLDDGPGLPTDFDIAGGKGLGMKIVQTFVKRIGGELRVLPGPSGRGACFNVTFSSARGGPRGNS
jgi:two-component system, sensor histidine kinase PdtaS